MTCLMLVVGGEKLKKYTINQCVLINMQMYAVSVIPIRIGNCGGSVEFAQRIVLKLWC